MNNDQNVQQQDQAAPAASETGDSQSSVTAETTPEVEAAAPAAPSDEPSSEASAATEQGEAESPDVSGAVAAEMPELKTGKPELPAEEMSFAEMFELAEKQSQEKRQKLKAAIGGDLRPGQIIFAKVVSIAGNSVFLDVGAKAEGVIEKSELQEEGAEEEVEVKEGDKVEARIRKIEGGTIVLGRVPPHLSLRRREELKEAHRTKTAVEGKVKGTNKGGFEVEVKGIPAFCPSSQIDLRPKKSDFYINKAFEFQVVEFKDGGRNIVISRRTILEEEQRKKAAALLEQLEEGAVLKGEVTSIKDYGAFVDLGGIEGLVHATEISHGHVAKPQMILKPGQDVEVMVLKIEEPKDEKKKGLPEHKKLSLSMKALQADPWDRAKAEFKEGDKVKGTVARIQNFGAFVQLLPGVDGLVHVSAMTLDRRIRNPGDVVKVGDEVEATVTSTDWSKRRIGLSMVKTPQELANELKQGKVMEGKVDRIEDFGVFVKLSNGARGLVPARETGTSQGTDLKKTFNSGDEIKVLVQDVDKKNGRIRMSIRAAREAEERAEYAGFINKKPSDGKLGTLGDLLKGKLGDIRQSLKD
ncbi:MAG: S1 RNA-binding domain-containing protein [Myxococcota bacterium]